MRAFSLKLTPAYAIVAGLGLTCASLFAAYAEDDAQIAQTQDGPRAGAPGMRGPGPGMRGMRGEGQRPDGQRTDGDRCQRLSEHLSKVDRHLTADQIHDILAGRLAQSGENTLKVGKTRTSGDVVSVDIVTTSGSLVSTREISMKTGLPANLVQRCQERQAQHTAAKGKDGDHDGGPHRGHMFRAHGGPGGMHGGMGGGGMRGHFGGNITGALAMIAGEPGRDLKLTADQGKKLAEAALVMAGNPHLKVGAVKEKDADTLTVDIVTQDNALVIRREINRHTGHAHKPAAA